MESLLDTTNLDYDGDDISLPPLGFERLHINGESYDLRDPGEVDKALDRVHHFREQLQNGDLDEYEGRSTDYGNGGRARLFHDELRVKFAEDFHEGKHDLTWEQQELESQRLIQIRASQTRAQGKW